MSNEDVQERMQESKREEKRAQFSGEGRKAGTTKLVVAVVALAAIAAYLVYTNVGGPMSRAPSTAPAVGAARGDELRIPLKDVGAGEAVFFEPKLPSGKSVRFFVVKTSDNTYRAALDACEVCFHARKGYYQEGEDMVCRNCERRFPAADIGPHNEGGCHPIALNREVVGDHLVIKTSELERGAAYF
jgi:uncharacterized membrane protein